MAEVGKEHWVCTLPNTCKHVVPAQWGSDDEIHTPQQPPSTRKTRPRRGNMVVIDLSKHESDEAHQFLPEAKC